MAGNDLGAARGAVPTRHAIYVTYRPRNFCTLGPLDMLLLKTGENPREPESAGFWWFRGLA